MNNLNFYNNGLAILFYIIQYENKLYAVMIKINTSMF